MKIGVISDVHSNQVALEKVMSQRNFRESKDIYCAGDLVGYYARPNEVVNTLRTNGVHSVKGNHDDAVVNSTPSNFSIYAKRAADWNRRNLTNENLEYLRSLPNRMHRFIGDRDIFVTHGSPRNPLSEYIFEKDVDELFLDFYFDVDPAVVILGHTHQPFVKAVRDTLVVNPGSVGQPRDGDARASYAIIDLETLNGKIERVEYDIDKVVAETSEELPRALGDRLFEGR